jgi:hypothetical protein
MLRSERAATRVASLRATRALASRRGDLARLKIGVPAFVEALWALVAPDARAARVSDSDATADPPDGAADAAPGDPEPGDPEASPDEAEASGDGNDDEGTTDETEKKTTFLRVDARSRFHALRALIAIVSASWRGAELLVGGAPNTSRGARAPVFHRDLEPLTRLVRPAAAGPGPGSASDADAVGDATREKAARLLSLLARTAHGRAALCHEEGANLPDALVAAVEAGARALRSVPGEKDDETETETENASDDVDASEEKDASMKRKKRRRLAAARVAATCARLLGCLEVSRGIFMPDPAFGAVAIAADAARARAARTMYDLFFRATVEVPVSARVAAGDALARLAAADARVAETIFSYGALAAIEAALPAADRLEREAGAAGDGDEAADTLFAEAFGVAPGKTDSATTDEDVGELSLSRDARSAFASVPATASFAAAALRLLEALAAHAFVRDAARDLERRGGTPWAWTLLHQAMPAAGAEADDAEAPPDAGTAEADDAEAPPDAPAPSPADDADPAGEVLPGEDADDAEPASLEGEDGDDAAAAAAAPAAASAPAPPFPERFERFPPPSSARDGFDSAGTEDAEETKDLNEEGDETRDATRDAPDVDWRALRSRGLASASRLDVSADASSASLLAAGRGGGEAATSVAFRFVPGDAPWNDPEVCSAALRALDALARDGSLPVSLGLPGDGARDARRSGTGEDVLTSLARDDGAGRRFLEAALFSSTRARRFFACVEPAARLLAALAEAEAASAASEPGAGAVTRDARRGDARDEELVSAEKTSTSFLPVASSAPFEKKRVGARKFVCGSGSRVSENTKTGGFHVFGERLRAPRRARLGARVRAARPRSAPAAPARARVHRGGAADSAADVFAVHDPPACAARCSLRSAERD